MNYQRIVDEFQKETKLKVREIYQFDRKNLLLNAYNSSDEFDPWYLYNPETKNSSQYSVEYDPQKFFNVLSKKSLWKK